MSEEPKKDEKPAAPAEKSQFLEKPAVRGLFTVTALFAPVPLLLVLIDLWLQFLAPEAEKASDAIAVFKQVLDGTGGNPPVYLIPFAVGLPAILLCVMYRRKSPVLLGMLLLLIATTAAEVFLFLPLTEEMNGG